MAHGIFIGDNVTSITDPAKIRTIQVYADIDNGAPITLGALVASGKYAGEAEVFTTANANGATAANVWVVTTPEIDYTNYALGDFFNASGAIGRAIAMEKYDIFSVTSDVLSDTPDTSNKKYIVAGDGRWTVSNASEASTKAFAQYLGSDVQDGVTFYVFEVL